jgi:hypothetical protein
MLNKVSINIRFIKATYDTKKEKREHVNKMLAEGWKIESENKLSVQFKKVFTI